MKEAILHHYRRLRDHGYTAEAALMGARNHLYFIECLRQQITEEKRRSRAAKKGWKTRRINQTKG